jgi:HEPN domain-containing protein
MKEAVVEWLTKASEDLLAVEKLSEDEHLTNIAAFHAQQCVEKSLKAILEDFGKKVPRTHDLIRLNGLAQSCIPLEFEENVLHELSTDYHGFRGG